MSLAAEKENPQDFTEIVNSERELDTHTLSVISAVIASDTELNTLTDRVVLSTNIPCANEAFMQNSEFIKMLCDSINYEFTPTENETGGDNIRLKETTQMTISIPVDFELCSGPPIEILNGFLIGGENLDTVILTDDFQPSYTFKQYLAHLLHDVRRIGGGEGQYLLDCSNANISTESILDIYDELNLYTIHRDERVDDIIIQDKNQFEMLLSESIWGLSGEVPSQKQRTEMTTQCKRCGTTELDIESHWRNSESCGPPEFSDAEVSHIQKVFAGILISGGHIKEQYGGCRLIYWDEQGEDAQSLSRVLGELANVFPTEEGGHVLRTNRCELTEEILSNWKKNKKEMLNRQRLSPVATGVIIDLCSTEGSRGVQIELPGVKLENETHEEYDSSPYGIPGRVREDGKIEIHLTDTFIKEMYNAVTDKTINIHTNKKRMVLQRFLTQPGYLYFISDPNFFEDAIRRYSGVQAEQTDKQLNW